PDCYGFFSQAEKYYLVMDFIEGGGRRSEDSIYNSLFSLYRNTSTHWGWKEHNYIGNIYQTNRLSESFREYWLAYRIEPLIRLAEQKGELDSSLAHKLIQLIDHLIEIWKLEKLTPRLIHGDLWSGNAIAGKEGKLYLIDPCLAFGHPEQDFGMMRMFGGFPGSSWMKRLGDSLSLDPELEERIPFWQIYPVLVHIVIFGRSYLSSLNTIIRAYS
ncbi:MAG: fructosamine kinase family protein, partial [Leptospiraceae bacterium]|nr:fructosamine kinase family protein [Leptospiraceae bacterium]